MTEYWSLGPHNFWTKWTVQGRRCTSSGILNVLMQERKEKEKADAAAAKNTDSIDFQGAFLYKKGGKTFQMTSDRAIAR